MECEVPQKEKEPSLPLSSWDFVDAASSLLENFETTAEAIKSDEDLANFVATTASQFPQIAMGFAQFASHAPMVGFAFAILNVIGKRVKSTSDTGKGYSELKKNLVFFSQIVACLNSKQFYRTETDDTAVRQAVEEFVDVLRQVVRLTLKYDQQQQHNRVLKFLVLFSKESLNRSALEDLIKKQDAAIRNLQFAMAVSMKSERPLTREEIESTIKKCLADDLNMPRLMYTLPSIIAREEEFEKKYSKEIERRFGYITGAHMDMKSVQLTQVNLLQVYIDPDAVEFNTEQRATADVLNAVVSARYRDDADGSSSVIRLKEAADIIQNLNAIADQQLHEDARRPLHAYLDAQTDAVVLIGLPGSGKSSALRQRALTWAEDRQTAFPIFVSLKHYAAEPPSQSFESYLAKIVNETAGFDTFDEASMCQLLRSSFVPVEIHLDGLDEILSVKARKSVVERIAAFHGKFGKQCNTKIVITTRPVGYELVASGLAGFKHLVLMSFSREQTSKFLDKWHEHAFESHESQNSETRRSNLDSAIRDNDSIAELVSNPLLLTLIAIVNKGQDLPMKRDQIYQKCSELLVNYWNQEVYRDGMEQALVRVDESCKTEILCNAAWHAHMERGEDKGYLIEEKALSAIISDALRRHLTLKKEDPQVEAISKSLLLLLVERHGVIISVGEKWYTFAHHTFQEYFAARAIEMKVRKGQLNSTALTDLIAEHALDSSWREVLLLASAIMEPAATAPGMLVMILFNPDLAVKCYAQKQGIFDDEAPAVGTVLLNHLMSSLSHDSSKRAGLSGSTLRLRHDPSSRVQALATLFGGREGVKEFFEKMISSSAPGETFPLTQGIQSYARTWPESIDSVLYPLCSKGMSHSAAFHAIVERFIADPLAAHSPNRTNIQCLCKQIVKAPFFSSSRDPIEEYFRMTGRISFVRIDPEREIATISGSNYSIRPDTSQSDKSTEPAVYFSEGQRLLAEFILLHYFNSPSDSSIGVFSAAVQLLSSNSLLTDLQQRLSSPANVEFESTVEAIKLLSIKEAAGMWESCELIVKSSRLTDDHLRTVKETLRSAELRNILLALLPEVSIPQISPFLDLIINCFSHLNDTRTRLQDCRRDNVGKPLAAALDMYFALHRDLRLFGHFPYFPGLSGVVGTLIRLTKRVKARGRQVSLSFESGD